MGGTCYRYYGVCCSIIVSIRCTTLRKAHFDGNWPPSVLEKMTDKLFWMLFPSFVAYRSNWQLSLPFILVCLKYKLLGKQSIVWTRLFFPSSILPTKVKEAFSSHCACDFEEEQLGRTTT